MPRRNHPPSRRRAWTSTPEEARPMTTEQMARSLVRRGLADPVVLGHQRRQPEDMSAPRERHPATAVAPGAGIEGPERGPDSPAMTGLRDADNRPTTERHTA